MVMTEVWAATPPPVENAAPRGKYDWADIVAKLTARPGEWLLIDEDASIGLQTAIRQRKMTALQDYEWDFKVSTRNNNRETGRCQVWMSAEKAEE
jgi:hypothetical protein